MVDADSLIDGDSVTTLADDLNAAMDRDGVARAAYRAIWGVEWVSLPTADGTPYFAAQLAANVRTESTESRTVR